MDVSDQHGDPTALLPATISLKAD